MGVLLWSMTAFLLGGDLFLPGWSKANDKCGYGWDNLDEK